MVLRVRAYVRRKLSSGFERMFGCCGRLRKKVTVWNDHSRVRVVDGPFGWRSKMKMLLKRWFPAMFAGEKHVEEVEQKPVVLPGDEKIMKHAGVRGGHPVAVAKFDGGEAHPDWIRSVEAERKRNTGWF